MKIRTQIFATLLPVVLALLGLLGALSVQFISVTVDRSTRASLVSAVDRLAAALATYNSFAAINGTNLSQNPAFRQYVEEDPGPLRSTLLGPRLLQSMRRTIEAFDGLYAIEYYDAQRSLELTLGRNRSPLWQPDAATQNLLADFQRRGDASRSYFQTYDQVPTLLMAHRVPRIQASPGLQAPRTTEGTLLLRFDLRRAADTALEALQPFEARLLLIDPAVGTVMFDSQPGRPAPSPAAVPLRAARGEVVALGGGLRAVRADYGDWQLLALVPERVFDRAWAPLRDTSLQILLITLIGGVGVLTLVTRSAFVRPIERLAEDVRRRATGEPIDIASYARTDEIHDLAKNFSQAMEAAETARAQAEDLASHDALTGLANRRVFQRLCARFIAGARRRGERVALLFVDLDNFKQVNDNYGHTAGDQLLIEFAQRLREVTRDSDLLLAGQSEQEPRGTPIARIAGDEFAILVDLKDSADATLIAERILTACDQPCSIEGKSLKILASIGIALYPDDASDAEQLYHHADAAMFQAKLAGKHSYYFFSAELAASIRRKQQIQDALRRSLERDEFHVLCQPYVKAGSREIAGGEVLLRWEQPQLGRVPPDEFIQIAESTGMMRDIDLWVLEQACRQIHDWCREGIRPIVLAVNVSAVELRNDQFPAQLAALLDRYAVPPSSIELELTETRLVATDERSLRILGELRDLGLSIALDDFGKGFTSLNQLKSYPVQKLKIDRSFVSEVGEQGDRLLIADVIMQLSNSYRLRTTAEGIETARQAEYMERSGCDYLQGYLFSTPLPLAELTERLRCGDRRFGDSTVNED